ncbi:hypothetical protein DICSQDRAFT_140031 [Dichomitus squalens LYAD-421 SS1]|uniref:Uncharacterized protein n=1 Tax=Dichomitus squalens (strain LYAD-421) TaxID=732165 RepID=R7SPA7_DICSQ|nr:uncharacterized protein DICSQDRAFT_140031 [Dichomitus squalens LYAD-421 SS1]EJF57743.1 hypothetical protein DICSQDRAFT_140031 [Dichomitus squalens LYAD-421 SS1]
MCGTVGSFAIAIFLRSPHLDGLHVRALSADQSVPMLLMSAGLNAVRNSRCPFARSAWAWPISCRTSRPFQRPTILGLPTQQPDRFVTAPHILAVSRATAFALPRNFAVAFGREN